MEPKETTRRDPNDPIPARRNTIHGEFQSRNVTKFTLWFYHGKEAKVPDIFRLKRMPKNLVKILYS